MPTAAKSFPNNQEQHKSEGGRVNTRACPSCGKLSIKGMPGGRDAHCHNCGFKDPCCYD